MRITHHQILFSNWQNRSKVTQTSCHIAADEWSLTSSAVTLLGTHAEEEAVAEKAVW